MTYSFDSVETALERYAKAGYSLALVFDDVGQYWALIDAGYAALFNRGENTVLGIVSALVRPEQWRLTLRGAVEAFVKANPLIEENAA